MLRTLIFVDFWNFQLNWNARNPHIWCDWQSIPKLFCSEVKSVFNSFAQDIDLSFEGIRIYASINPDKLPDTKLRNWFSNSLNNQSGFSVFIKERHSKKKSIVCDYCKHEVINCPSCKRPYHRASEKGVDSAIITDMFALYIDGVYNIAVIVSADSDMIPMVKYLQNHNVKVINASWKGHGYDLRQSCWASFEIDKIANQLILNK
ncbi:MAG: NYN domain-containing protein [Candidatus Hatepunaea meridiana]|nr:NYN domain-containing protein [Candidatus Hatepunaea meridiana]